MSPAAQISDRNNAPAGLPGGTRCLRCNYDLRGQVADGRCPECGLAVRRSTADPTELHLAPPQWLGGLTIGAALVLGAQLLYAATVLLVGPADFGYQIVLALDDVTALALAAGVWLLTRRQRGFGPTGLLLRWFLRLEAALPVASCALIRAGFYTGNMGHFTTAYHVSQGAVFLPLLLFLHLARLARRASRPSLAEHCATAGLGLTSSLILTAGLAWAERAHWFRTGTPLAASLLAGCLIIAFYLWTMASLVRFIVSFRRVWRASRNEK